MADLIKKVVLLFLIAGLIYSLSKNIVEYQKKTAFFSSYQEEYDKQKKKKRELQSEIAKSKDYYLVEKNIREKLNLLRPDEVSVILPRPTIFPSPTPLAVKPAHEQWIELFW